MTWQSIIRSKITSWVFALVLVGVGFSAGRVYLQKKQIDSEIAKLQAQAEEIAQTNQELSGLIKYLNTPEFQEKEAREKLNLKKEGEFVVVLPNDEQLVSGATSEQSSQSNTSKWFNYFFSKQ